MKSLVLSGLLSVVALSGIAGGAAVSAKEPQSWAGHDEHFRVRRYVVFYRTCGHEPWRYHGSYSTDWEAHRAERHLERRGYEARVQHPHHR